MRFSVSAIVAHFIHPTPCISRHLILSYHHYNYTYTHGHTSIHSHTHPPFLTTPSYNIFAPEEEEERALRKHVLKMCFCLVWQKKTFVLVSKSEREMLHQRSVVVVTLRFFYCFSSSLSKDA